MARPLPDEQRSLDSEDAALRLKLLVAAIEEERAAAERVVSCRAELCRAKASLREAKRRLQERSFIERKRAGGVT